MKKNNKELTRFERLQKKEQEAYKDLNKELKKNNRGETLKNFGVIAGVIFLIATGLFLIVPFFWYAFKDR